MLKLFFALVLALVLRAWAGSAEDKALVDAAFGLDIRGVHAALAKGGDPNAQKYDRSPAGGVISKPVLLSAIFGKPNAAIQASRARLKETEWNQFIAGAQAAIAKALFQAGARLDRLDEISCSFLFSRSIEIGNFDLVELLLDQGVPPTFEFTGTGESLSPTELAKKNGHEEIYKLLVSRGGAPVDSKSAAQLALMSAVERGDVLGMKRAIREGAEINALFDGQTALNAAVGQRIYEQTQSEAILWLLEHGADPNARDESHFSLPLHRFIWMSADTLHGIGTIKEEKLKELSLLIGKDISVKIVETLNETVLIHLLRAGAKTSATDKNEWTPLHVAARFDNIMAAQILIRERAKIMPRDDKGKTPLDYAESAAMIKLLKQNGATER